MLLARKNEAHLMVFAVVKELPAGGNIS